MPIRTVTGTILDADLTAYPNSPVSFFLEEDFIDAGVTYLRSEVAVLPDPVTGYFSVGLTVPTAPATAIYRIRLVSGSEVWTYLADGPAVDIATIFTLTASPIVQSALQTVIDTHAIAHDPHLGGIPINVKTYGAIGNGIADDTVAIQAAIDAASVQVNCDYGDTTGTTVYFPPGVYKVSSTIDMKGVPANGRGITILGDGYVKSTIHFTSAADTLFDYGASTNYRGTISGIRFAGIQYGTDQIAIACGVTVSLTVRDCWFDYFGYSIYANGTAELIIDNCFFELCAEVIYFASGSNLQVNSCVFYHNGWGAPDGVIEVMNSNDINMSNNWFGDDASIQTADKYIYIVLSNDILFTNNIVNSDTFNPFTVNSVFKIRECTRTVVSHNTFTANQAAIIILVDHGCHAVVVSDNIIYNRGGGWASPIAVTDTVGGLVNYDIVIAGNVIEPGTHTNDIAISNGTDMIVSNNLCHRNVFVDQQCRAKGLETNLIQGSLTYYTAAPNQFSWKIGDTILTTTPASGQPPGWICTHSGTFSAATDNTGDTDGATAVITGMTDTSDFAVGNFVDVSAGFPTTGPYRIIAKTAATITLDTASDAAVNNITVDTSDPTWTAMANLA